MSLTIQIPAGYRKVKWEDVQEGDTVYLLGTTFKSGVWIPYAYGPHLVTDLKGRRLMNKRIQHQFMHYPEDLLVKE